MFNHFIIIIIIDLSYLNGDKMVAFSSSSFYLFIHSFMTRLFNPCMKLDALYVSHHSQFASLLQLQGYFHSNANTHLLLLLTLLVSLVIVMLMNDGILFENLALFQFLVL